MQQFGQVFQQLGQDLQSGNLSAAQSDLLTLQQSVLLAASIEASSSKDRIAHDVGQLSKDLQSGNISAAQRTTRPCSGTFRIGQPIATFVTSEAGRAGSARSLAG